MTATPASALHIRRLHAHYQVAREHPAPELVQARLDEAANRNLASTLSTLLTAWFDHAGPDIWLLRRLAVEVDVNAAWEPETLARTWAQAIARALSNALDRSDYDNAVWFPHRDAYLARFLADVADGHAWGKWYYESFAGLRMLPTSATLRTAICEQPPLGQAALLELSPLELGQVLHALTLQDVRRILDSLAEHTPAGGEFDSFQAVWSAWPALPAEDRQGYRPSADDWHSALHLYLEASRRAGQAGGLPLRTATLALLRLARCLADYARISGMPAPAQPPPLTVEPTVLPGDAGSLDQRLLALLSQGNRAELYRAISQVDAETLASLLRHLPASVQADFARISGFPTPGQPPPPAAELAALPGATDSPAHRLLALLSRGDRAELYRAVGPVDAEILAPLLRCPPVWVQEVGQTLLTGNPLQVTDNTAAAVPAVLPLRSAEGMAGRNRALFPDDRVAATSERRYTTLGGVFLLLPLLDELPLTEAVQDWPRLEEIDTVALVRFLLLVQCCGQPRAQHAINDPLLRELLTVPPSLSPAWLADWGARLSPAQQHTLLATLARWHGERGAVTGEVRILARSPARGAPLVVWLDGARGIWLAVYRYSPRQAERLPALLRERLAGEEEPAVLLGPADWLEPLRRAFPASRILDLAEAAGTLTGEAPDLAERLARLPKLSAELAYLSLPRSWGPARPWQWTLSVAAQGLLRNFAWRLPGFAGSNLPYLYSNFLDLSASLEDEPTRRLVRLGRPPLHLILTMTGMLRKAYRLSWLDDRPFVLFPED